MRLANLTGKGEIEKREKRESEDQSKELNCKKAILNFFTKIFVLAGSHCIYLEVAKVEEYKKASVDNAIRC